MDEVFSHRSEIPIGATVELRVVDADFDQVEETPTMTLMRLWLEEDATDDPAEREAAQEGLNGFERNMNQPRRLAGARLHYPEAE